MVNARMLTTSSYRGVVVKKIYYFREILFLFKIGEYLHVSSKYHNVKMQIKNSHKNYGR